MGSFSWNKADKLTAIENIACGASFKFLIPKEFGGGFIKDKYQDYGYLDLKIDGKPKYDMYELLAFWNKAEGLNYDGEYPLMKEIDEYTRKNRIKGIDIGCYENEILLLKYPLKSLSSLLRRDDILLCVHSQLSIVNCQLSTPTCCNSVPPS